MALLGLAPPALVGGLVGATRAGAVGTPASSGGYFLTSAELETLRALCDRFIPGPPEDSDPGALDAGVPEFIDLFLGAFETGAPPRIFADGPFSNRNGSTHDDFADFLALDEVEELVWRTRIEGSRGIPEREWNGPVDGLQDQYREGLATLDAVARARGGRRFHELPRWFQDLVVTFPPSNLTEFLDLAWDHAVEGMYSPPEYGGNRGLVGWTYVGWPGDTQPRGWTDAEVSNP